MSPTAIEAYSNRLNDERIFHRDAGILSNFLESCAIQISDAYRHTAIEGTNYTGINVEIIAIANTFAHREIKDTDINQITVGLSIPSSQFEHISRDSFEMRVTLEARVYLPPSPITRSVDDVWNTEMQHRDLRNTLAIVDGLYLALTDIPYYRNGILTGKIISASSMQHNFATMPIIICEYDIPVYIEHITSPTNLLINMNVGETELNWNVIQPQELNK